MAEEQNVEGTISEQNEATGSTSQAENTTQYTETELRAMEMGWKPKDQWEGDPNEHRSAKEYIDRGELLGKLKQQGSELRELKAMVSTLSEHNRKVHAEAYRQAITD
jgi:hypothetical protein